MRNKNKKAYMRTIEVIIAVLIALFFMSYLVSQKVPQGEKIGLDLSTLRADDGFRACAIADDYACLNAVTRSKVPLAYSFAINDSSLYYPDTAHNVFVESFLISGSIDSFHPNEIRIYYWKR